MLIVWDWQLATDRTIYNAGTASPYWPTLLSFPIIMTCFFNTRPLATRDFFFERLLNSIPAEHLLYTHRATVDTEKNELRLSIDLPGVKSSDLSVTTDGDVIHITASRHISTIGGRSNKKSRISKSFHVDSQTVDLSQLKANLTNGVLVLSAPNKEKPEPRSIEVTSDADTDEHPEQENEPGEEGPLAAEDSKDEEKNDVVGVQHT
jgi:HSP20 family molecular chaperone IbpA